MDYRTLFIFDAASLVVYAIAITALALRNRKMTGLRWFALSVLLQLAQTLLEAMRGIWPPMFTVLLPTLVNGIAFCALYMGFHWTLRKRPLKTWVGPVLLYMALTGYAGLYFLHSPYDFMLGMAPVFVSAGLAAGLLVRLGKGAIESVSRVTAGVLAVYMALLVYRTVVISGSYGYGSTERDLNDPRLLYSMLGLMVMGGCLVLMYVWFFVAERWGDLALTARLDPLTGVLNRRAVDEGARREISRARRSGTPLALLVMDIDHFKRINDVYGHRGGDEALRAFVAVLRRELREVDILGRIGGEEFVVFLPDTTAERGMQTAERLRAATELSTVIFGGRVIKLTMTTGVTQWMPDESSWEGMLIRADEALYAGKNQGRNRVVLDRHLVSKELHPSGTLHKFAAPAGRK